MATNKINSVSEVVDNGGVKLGTDLEQALAVAGVGWYTIKYCVVLALFLISCIVEMIGYSYVLPTARCDLNMTDSQRGFIASIPYIMVVLTSFAWGYLLDTKGRKWVLVYSSIGAGVFGIAAAFMPELISFVFFKFLSAICATCPCSAPYTFIGEIMPKKQRDMALSVTNAMQVMGSAFVPLLAWAILPLDFRVDFGSYDFRPWRLLTIIYSGFFLLSAFFMAFGPESPKFLLSQGKNEEALKTLQTMYAGNKGKDPEDYPVKSLQTTDDSEKQKVGFFTSLKIQSVPLLKPPYLKWLLLNGFLLFGVFSVINGLYMWVPDILNRVLSEGGSGMTACEVISLRFNETADDTVCTDTIERTTFVINSIGNCSLFVIAIAVSVTLKFVGKKILISGIFFLIGALCVSINFITQDMLFAVLLTALQLIAVCVGPINAYNVDIFPTHLRGMAVGLTMTMGRSGSVIGTNITGVMINNVCEATFYMFGGLIFLCGFLTFVLPKTSKS